MLFDQSVYDNLGYADRSASHDLSKLQRKKANAHGTFITRLGQGLWYAISEDGCALIGVWSKGQRIAIASRHPWKDAPILWLDEATSALDAESGIAKVQAGLLEPLMKDEPAWLLRIRWRRFWMQIGFMVLDQGGLLPKRTHSWLLESCGVV